MLRAQDCEKRARFRASLRYAKGQYRVKRPPRIASTAGNVLKKLDSPSPRPYDAENE